jgi:integrase
MHPAQFENPLTFQDSISYLLGEESEKMKGTIRTKEKCPVCHGKFTEIKKLGFICQEDQTTPKRFYIDFWYKGQRFRLFSDQQGQIIDSYNRARNLLARVNNEIDNHTFDPTNYIKQELEKFYTSNLLDTFLNYKLTGDRIAPSYASHYKRYAGIAEKYFGSQDVRDLRKLDIINYTDHIRENYDFSNKTLKNCLNIFKTFMFYLKNDLEILNSIPHFPRIEVPEPKTHWLTPEAQKNVFGYIPDQDKPIIAFLMLSGCRPGEARALKCKNVDLEQETITISATFSGNVYREKRKGQISRSVTIPIHGEIFGYLKHRVQNNLPEAYIFINANNGLHYSRAKLGRVWDNARNKAGLDMSIRLYDATRHSFATQLVNSGVPIFSISKLLGHADIRTSEKYSHEDMSKLKIDISSLSLEEKVTKLAKSKNVGNSKS